jgi:alpha-glucosidase
MSIPELLSDDSSAEHVRSTVRTLEARMSEGWPCWALSNHDVRRVVTRWGGEHASAVLANQLLAMLCSLRGSVCLYQGEELGLPEASLPFQALRDPYGIAFYPNFKGRDGCRTPMPWEDAEYAGFSAVAPWLPIAEEHRPLSVSRQERDPQSTLHRFRSFLRWRREHPELIHGDISIVSLHDEILAFERRWQNSRLLVAFNFSPQALNVDLPWLTEFAQIEGAGFLSGELMGSRLQLPAHGTVFARPR